MFELLNIVLVLDYTLLNLASLWYVFIYGGLCEKWTKAAGRQVLSSKLLSKPYHLQIRVSKLEYQITAEVFTSTRMHKYYIIWHRETINQRYYQMCITSKPTTPSLLRWPRPHPQKHLSECLDMWWPTCPFHAYKFQYISLELPHIARIGF